MRRAEDRPDPWSPFGMRPAFFLVIATAAVGICGFLVFAYFASRPHDLHLPIDARTGEPATFGIYIDSAVYCRTDPKTGVLTNGSVFNPTWPFGLAVAAWDDGRVVWSVGARPEDGELAWTTRDRDLVASARQRLASALSAPGWPTEPPYVSSDGPRSILFVRDGDRYQKFWCQSWQVEPQVEDEVRLAPFREKWAACRGIAMSVIPAYGSKKAADWISFQRDDPR